MDELRKAEIKDKFLDYALSVDNYFMPDILYGKFLSPDYDLQYVHTLIKEIIDHDPDLLDIMAGNGAKIFMLSATAYTNDFLKEGGFSQMAMTEERKWGVFLQQLSNTRILTKKEKANLVQNTFKEAQIDRLSWGILFGGMLLSLLLSAYSLYRTLSVDDRSGMERRLEERFEQLELRLTKENEVLLDEVARLKVVREQENPAASTKPAIGP